MPTLKFQSLGEAWINLLQRTLNDGDPLGDEATELLNVQAAFPADNEPDILLARFGNTQLIADMQKVFFTNEPNALGHSYAALMKGPGGRGDLEDVIGLLRKERLSKRAVLTLCGVGDGKVPCINVIQFLVRAERVETTYFARGQDVYNKFYADGLCVALMSRRVAGSLGLPAGNVTGFISSLHLYTCDIPAVRQVLVQAEPMAFSHAGGR
jgi:hypothetical protein